MAVLSSLLNLTKQSGQPIVLKSQNGYWLKFQPCIQNPSQWDVSVQDQGRWHLVRSYDLPKELPKPFASQQAHTFIQLGSWRVAKLSNGDFKPQVMHALKGGMLARREAERRLQNAITELSINPQHTALVNAIDSALLQAAPQFLSGKECLQIRAGGLAGGFVGGGGIGALVILAMFSNPASGAVAGVSLVGGFIGAVVGNWLARLSIEDQKKRASELIHEVKTVAVLPFAEATPLLLSQNPEERREGQEKIHDAIEDLRLKGYIRVLDIDNLELNQDKLREACLHIPQDQRDNARLTLELTILLVINSAAHGTRPITHLCTSFDDLSSRLDHLVDLKAFVDLTLGYLYVQRGYAGRAIGFFERIPREHSLSPSRDACIQALQAHAIEGDNS